MERKTLIEIVGGVKTLAKVAFVTYITSVSLVEPFYDLKTKTGHPSADIYFRLNEPTIAEQFLINYVEKNKGEQK